jgi:hypothetical protein
MKVVLRKLILAVWLLILAVVLAMWIRSDWGYDDWTASHSALGTGGFQDGWCLASRPGYIEFWYQQRYGDDPYAPGTVSHFAKRDPPQAGSFEESKWNREYPGIRGVQFRHATGVSRERGDFFTGTPKLVGQYVVWNIYLA